MALDFSFSREHDDWRMYVREFFSPTEKFIKQTAGTTCDPNSWRWRIAFDFAQVPMPTGCEPGALPGTPLLPGQCPGQVAKCYGNAAAGVRN